MQHRERERRRTGNVLTIGQLAELTGVGAKTIRYYESIGLLPRPARAENSYRRYGTADVNRLLLLRRIRYLGVPLSVAKPLLLDATDARCADVQRELLALVEQRLRTLDREIAELEQLRSDVKGYQRRLEACCEENGDTSEQLQFSACSDMRCISVPGKAGGVSNDDDIDDNPCVR